MTAAVKSLRAGWDRFWFTPTSTAPVELFRIGFGVMAILWLLSLAPGMSPFYGAGAAVPSEPLPFGAWTLFTLVGGSPLIWVLWLLGLVAAIALTVGYRTRAAAMVVFVIMVSLTRTAPNVFNSGDGLVRILAFYMMLMPAGSAVSVDRWRSGQGDMWSFPRRAPWALRLVQIQVSVVYLETVWEKTGGVLWRNGTAVSYSLRVEDITRLPAPHFVADSVVLSELMTYGTLAIEVAVGVLVWNKVARPWVLWLGVLLHLSIELSLDIGFFSLAMLIAYLAFLSPQTATRVMRWGRDRLMARGNRRREREVPASPPVARTASTARRTAADPRGPDSGVADSGGSGSRESDSAESGAATPVGASSAD